MYICKEHEALECPNGRGKLCCCACSEDGCLDRCEEGKYGVKADCKFCEEEER